MKIIRQGKLPEEQAYRAECYRCDTIFEFQRKEATFQRDQRDGDCLVIECPHCDTVAFVDIKNKYDGPG